MRSSRWSGLALLWVSLCCGYAAAHEVPADVRIQIYLKPMGESLIVLVRVPLESMRDFEFAQRSPGILDLGAVEPQLRDAARLWLLDDLVFYQEDRRLADPEIRAVRVALPTDPSFEEFATALVAVRGERLPVETELPWRQALLDVELRYSIDSTQARFHLEPTLARLGLQTLVQVRLVRDGESVRGVSFVGDPGRISLEPSWVEVFARFIGSGFTHVLDGADHLLFVFALVIPLWRWRPLVAVITAFTLAHSLTLAASLLNLVPTALWFPALVELLIAASILLMALDNLFETTMRRRWLIAFGFGLVHGFGFSFALRDMLAFAGDHLAVSLLAFNLGVEFGQILVLAVLFPLLVLAGRYLPRRMLVIVLSAFVAHSGWHWVTERFSTLSAYRFIFPEVDQAFIAGGMRWLMLLLTAALLVWLARGLFDRFSVEGEVEQR